MSTLSPQSQTVLNTFGRQPGVTPDQLTNLQAIINGSPALVDEINAAVAAGHLRQIDPLTNPHAGGEYGSANQAMYLPLAKLTPPLTTENIGEMTFVLGHELQHGPNRTAVAHAKVDFARDVEQKTQEPGGRHDYTAVLERKLGVHRQNEAGAEIAGWNAVVSAVKATNQNPSLQDIYGFKPSRMEDFIDRTGTNPNYSYALKPNLSLNTDMTLSANAANLEAMGQNYFDKPASPAPLGIGHHGDSDYRNYYAASDVGYIVQMERHFNPTQPGITPPTIAINMQQLKLSEAQMERNGIDLGSNQNPMLYRDISTTPATAHHFDHTHNRVTHPNDGGHQYIPIAPAAISQDITHPDHLGNRLYRQAVDAIEQSPNIPQHLFTGDRLKQAAANLTAVSVAGEHRPNDAGHNERLGQIDYAVFNKDHRGLIAGQGEIGNPTSKHAYLSATQDNATSLAVASQQVHDVLQRSQSIALSTTPLQQALSAATPETETPGPRR